MLRFNEDDSIDTPFWFGYLGKSYGLSAWRHRVDGGNGSWYLALTVLNRTTWYFDSVVSEPMPGVFDESVGLAFVERCNAYLASLDPDAPPPVDLEAVAREFWRVFHSHTFRDGQLVPKDPPADPGELSA